MTQLTQIFQKWNISLVKVKMCKGNQTRYLTFSHVTYAARSKHSIYIAMLDGFSILPCAEVKHFGVIIDHGLSFQAHVDIIRQHSFILETLLK